MTYKERNEDFMPLTRFPPALQAIVDAYDPATGCYRNADGTLDPCHTELETLETWRGLLLCIKPRIIVETGVYYGLATCFMASAMLESGSADGIIHAVDPWPLPHLWEGSDLERLINFIPKTTQDALPDLELLDIDVLVIDSIHTYNQSSFELQALEPRVREGGFIIMHDSLYFDGVGRTAQHLYDDPRFEVITFDTPRTSASPNVQSGRTSMGCTIARKVRAGPPITQDESWLGLPELPPAGPDAHLRNLTRGAAIAGRRRG